MNPLICAPHVPKLERGWGQFIEEEDAAPTGSSRHQGRRQATKSSIWSKVRVELGKLWTTQVVQSVSHHGLGGRTPCDSLRINTVLPAGS